MQFLMDSDVFIDYLAAKPDAMRLVEDFLPAGIAISIVTYMESYEGTFLEPDPVASQLRHAEHLTGIPVLPFSKRAAELCAWLRHQLHLEGKRVRPRALDLMIAATALEHGLTLVTRNRVDYQDIPGLALA